MQCDDVFFMFAIRVIVETKNNMNKFVAKTVLKCSICNEYVYMDIDEIWCACHIQKTIDCIPGVQPSFWYDASENIPPHDGILPHD